MYKKRTKSTLKFISGILLTMLKKCTPKDSKKQTTKPVKRSSPCIIGIDPGQKGAAVSLNTDGTIGDKVYFGARNTDWPTELAKLLKTFKPKDTLVYLEQVHAYPGQGAVSTFTFGTNFGIVSGMLLGMGFLNVYLTLPRSWQKVVWLDGFLANRDVGPKPKSKETAIKLFGAENLCIWPSKKMNEGLVDATLIAEYGRRRWKVLTEENIDENIAV